MEIRKFPFFIPNEYIFVSAAHFGAFAKEEEVLNTFYLEMPSQHHSSITADGVFQIPPITSSTDAQRSVFSDCLMRKDAFAL